MLFKKSLFFDLFVLRLLKVLSPLGVLFPSLVDSTLFKIFVYWIALVFSAWTLRFVVEGYLLFISFLSWALVSFHHFNEKFCFFFFFERGLSGGSLLWSLGVAPFDECNGNKERRKRERRIKLEGEKEKAPTTLVCGGESLWWKTDKKKEKKSAMEKIRRKE